jgi:hypothetical protein
MSKNLKIQWPSSKRTLTSNSLTQSTTHTLWKHLWFYYIYSLYVEIFLIKNCGAKTEISNYINYSALLWQTWKGTMVYWWNLDM